MNRLRLTALVLMCFAFISHSSVRGETHRDDQNHFSIVIPDDWAAMDSASLETLNQVVKQQSGDLTIKYEAGYQVAGAPPFSYPYILVQVSRQDFSDTTYGAIERGMGKSFNDGIKKAADEFSDFVQDAEAGKTVLDRENGRTLTPIVMEVFGVGKIQGISVGWLGKKGMVSIHCYALAGEFDKWSPTFEEITNSLRFDEGYKFEPKMNKVMSSAMRGALIGGIAGGLGSLIVAGLRAAKKKQAD